MACLLAAVQHTAVSYLQEWRKYGVDQSSECDLIQYWGEPQLGRASDGSSFYTRDLGDCHDGVQLEDSCYRLSETSEGLVDWQTAEEVCVAWGGHLATVEDSDEATALANLVRPIGDAARWVGLSTTGDCTGTYHWSSFAQVNLSASYLMFASNSTVTDASGHCVSVRLI
jgi:hypothetical protein